MKQAILCMILLAATMPGSQVTYDRYGDAPFVGGEAKGFFSLSQVGDRWWLLTPDGHGFISIGVTHIFQGTRQPIFQKRYNGSQAAYTADVAENLKEWGFNSAGYGCTSEMAQHLPFMVSIEVLFTSRWRGAQFHYDDVFGPGWQRQAATEIGRVCQSVRNNKNLIG